MPQLFQVLKCYKCFVFQVHQTKKSNKWECKLCGEKQSIKRHYGLGTGKECRLHVQKLNGVRGEITELNLITESDEELEEEIINSPNKSLSNRFNTQKLESKWSDYVENEPAVEDNGEIMYLDDVKVVLEKPTKYRKIGNSFNINKMTKSVDSQCNEDNILNASNIEPLRQIKALDKNHKRDFKQFIIPIKKSPKCEINENNSSGDNDNIKIILKENKYISSPDSVNAAQQTENTYDIGNRNIEPDIPLRHRWAKNQIDNNTLSSVTFLPTKINKNSKWAQFTDVSDTLDENNETESESREVNNSQPIPEVKALFSLCDDSDLDSILDI